MNVKQKLLEKAEEKYRKFSQSLIPNIDNVLGVRLPVLRKIAKEIYKSDNWKDFLKQNDFEYMEEYITAIENTVMGNVLNVINNETSTQ